MKYKMFLFALLLVVFSTQVSYSQDTIWTRRYNIPGSIKNAVFSPDDSKILVTGTETFFEVNPETGDMIRELPEFTKYGIVGINAETNIGLTYNCQLVNLIDYKKIRDVFSTKYFDTNVTLVYNITYTKDLNKFAMVYYNSDGITPSSVIIRDLEKETEKLIYSEGTIDDEGFYTCALSPDGRYLATISDYIGEIGTTEDNRIFIKLFDLNTNEMLKKIEYPYTQNRWTMKFSPDGSMLAVHKGGVDVFTVPNLEFKDNFSLSELGNTIFDYKFTKNSKDIIMCGSGAPMQRYQINEKKLKASYLYLFSNRGIIIPNILNTKLVSHGSVSLYCYKDNMTTVDDSKPQLIYPNPTNWQLILKLPIFQISSFKISILNSAGQSIYFKDYQPTNEEISINVAHFPKGVFFINVENNNQILQTLKFIKE